MWYIVASINVVQVSHKQYLRRTKCSSSGLLQEPLKLHILSNSVQLTALAVLGLHSYDWT